jgi:hypothetical protein
MTTWSQAAIPFERFTTTMDFDETRLYYSHQQLHNTNAVNAENEDEAPPVVPELEEAQVPVAAMRRHFREFFRTWEVTAILCLDCTVMHSSVSLV